MRREEVDALGGVAPDVEERVEGAVPDVLPAEPPHLGGEGEGER